MRFRCTIFTLVVTIMSVLALGTGNGSAQGPTVTKFTITFRTTSDDKDYDTQVQDRIIFNNVDTASLYCCSGGSSSDYWSDGSAVSRDISILHAIDKAAVPNCTLVLGSRAYGDDKWVFVPTLHIQYSDGTSEDRTYGGTTLNSRGGEAVVRRYRIGDSH